MRSILVTGALAMAVWPALAQSEAEKRRQHVPYVRAATDCVASVVRRDDQFDSAVAYDSFQPLLNRAVSVCQQSMALMISTHDTIYGFGGQTFYSGPYLTDLERAVRGRLATQIASSRANAERQATERQAAEERARAERQAQQERERAEREAAAARAEAQRLEAETRARVARVEKLELLEKTRDLIRTKTLACIGKEGATMLLTDEKAEVVAKAAMIFCESDIDALIRVTTQIVEVESGSQSNRSQVRELAETRVRDVVTAYVVRSRGDLIGKNLREQQTPSSAPGSTRNSPTL
ncbi:hypothetical protein OIU35_15275 [Boseaceae bacterium BT-24-1]|nr:hypothetical protein [Boseaceae bacterium BT-24-1]